MTRYLSTTALTVALAITGALPAAADWRDDLGTLNVGLLGGENEADRLKRTECFAELLEERLGLPVDLYPASDYAGVMQGLLAGQLHMAGMSPNAYAGVELQDPDAVYPAVISTQLDGSLGYYSVMYTRTDSGITSLEEMEGKTLVWSDVNSASGYLIPKSEIESMGIDIDSYFTSTGFGGGHEQSAIAVLNEQYDAGVTWISGQGEHSEGYTRGNFRRMVNNGLIDMNDVQVIWKSSIIPNGPTVLRSDLPQEARDIVTGFMVRMHIDHPECYGQFVGGDGGGYVAVADSFYDGIIETRRREVEGSR